MRKIKTNMKKAIILAGAISLAAVGGASAYLTDYDKTDHANIKAFRFVLN